MLKVGLVWLCRGCCSPGLLIERPREFDWFQNFKPINSQTAFSRSEAQYFHPGKFGGIKKISIGQGQLEISPSSLKLEIFRRPESLTNRLVQTTFGRPTSHRSSSARIGAEFD